MWTLSNWFGYVWGKFRLNYYIIVELVFKILSTLAATVAVKNSKNLKTWPLLRRNLRCLVGWLDNVKDYRNPVLIGLSNSSYICVSSECFDWPKRFLRHFAILKKGQIHLRWRLFCNNFRNILLNQKRMIAIGIEFKIFKCFYRFRSFFLWRLSYGFHYEL